KYIQTNIKKVKGDFRQEEILKAWEKLILFPALEGRGKGRVTHSVSINLFSEKYQIINLKLSVGSGTYIRSIAHDLGKMLGVGGVLFGLKRTRVGKFT
ncbi:MAG: hypothetical protein JNN11_03525, partial [Candidatus Doudnabacteria bacterium]|nr:hypothetical protein [Candidatus Doudnabacteria bacterium]